MQEADTGVLTPAQETESLLGKPQRGRPRNAAWPDWTDEQVAILQEAGRKYRSAGGKNISWKRALEENPSWQGILLGGGRPFYHLWHTAAEILSGHRPTRPGAGKKAGLSMRRKAVNSAVKDAAPSRVAGGHKAWQTRRQNAVNSTHQPPAPEQRQFLPTMKRVDHCPECGAHLLPYHRAKELTQ